ncbi:MULTISPECIES: carbon-phosphorus lyase complex subunit PhnI [unclassified Adlercreutzia]|uniref:carbon-phosphorus lyase complex subunit PhnI n=1 Tax=unclassified Adlercreutzia TaxID=2636013 RepID=UPI0013EE119C|nr:MULTISPECIES: carbon-phosphorus lyase complex subunit PhnI [unclassified Adlercreutzia]
MGYVAVRGGGRAIEESLRLLEAERLSSAADASAAAIASTLPDLVDQVMGEASLFAPRLAALALKQAQGSPDEAVFLLRAFRSTLERPYVSRVIDTAGMYVRRRISAAFKDVPGGQVLGATRDYSHRLVNFDLASEDAATRAEQARALSAHFAAAELQALRASDEALRDAEEEGRDPLSSCGRLPRALDYLRDQGLVAPAAPAGAAAPPDDATMTPLVIPASRSMRLQTLARGMTQAVEALGYAAIRGFGPAHPTVGELRSGLLEVVIDRPLGTGELADAYYAGTVSATEVESLFMADARDEGEGADAGLAFEVGYGMVFGRCESKAIAMSVLDRCLEIGDARYPTQDEEFVLYHVDGVEASGFISHLKLPHYVTFQSKLSSVRSTRAPGAEPSPPAELHSPAGSSAHGESSPPAEPHSPDLPHQEDVEGVADAATL